MLFRSILLRLLLALAAREGALRCCVVSALRGRPSSSSLLRREPSVEEGVVRSRLPSSSTRTPALPDPGDCLSSATPSDSPNATVLDPLSVPSKPLLSKPAPGVPGPSLADALAARRASVETTAADDMLVHALVPRRWSLPSCWGERGSAWRGRKRWQPWRADAERKIGRAHV